MKITRFCQLMQYNAEKPDEISTSRWNAMFKFFAVRIGERLDSNHENCPQCCGIVTLSMGETRFECDLCNYNTLSIRL